MKIGFWTFEKVDNRQENSVGSSRIRGRWVYDNWDDAELAHVGKRYDVVVLQKAYWDMGLDLVKNHDGICIFDEADPAWLERPDAFQYYSAVDAVVTSTQQLADFIKKVIPNQRVVCIPDRVELKEHKPVKKAHAKNLKKLVWFGYTHNFPYLKDALKKVAKEDMEITIYSDSSVAASAGSNLKLSWKKYDYNTIHSELIKHDAAILPSDRGLVDVRGKYKSNNKPVTCWALGLPVIGVPEDFDRLRTQSSREAEAKEKLELVKKEYDVKLSVKEYKKLIKEIQNEN